MISEMMEKLWANGILQLGVWETIYMTLLSTLFSYAIGLPLGLILAVTSDDGIHPIPWLNRILGILVNVFRSMPFIILMVAMLPVAKAVVGTSLGNQAMIVTLVIAAAPYVARMVESSIREVNAGVIEAAQAMGSTSLQIVWKVLIPESMPSLISNITIALTTILGYSALSGMIGGGGLGKIAINYGYYRYETLVMLIAVVLLIIIVQIFQSVGTRLAARSDKRLRK